MQDYSTIIGDSELSPFVGGPPFGGDADTTGSTTHISTGGNTASSSTAGRAQHWSNLLDWRQGPLFWLAIATILYLGLLSLHVGARAGHFRIGAGAGR